ncbi:alpha/beta family hydrolase [Euzebya tangerina]|uniref:alpha/beta family hydrolase n=1 Tax=Euzebya tangerina TaxID=591198 RepID=UPI000E30B78A|nr:alpha/beta family hydrolase [Euzebya tangerina]
MCTSERAPELVTVPLSPPQAAEATTAQVWPDGERGRAAVILAHGAGTSMAHRHMQRHAADLVAAGHPTALFNFAYTEMGRKRPDPAPRLVSAWRDVIAALSPRIAEGRPLVIGGRSMGGRIASIVAAEDPSLPVDGVACLAYPLHPPGRQDRLRVDHWPDLTVPVLLLCGSRDPMAPTDTLEANVSEHMPAGLCTTHVLAAADHSFKPRKMDGRTEDEVFAEAASVLVSWMAALPGSVSQIDQN